MAMAATKSTTTPEGQSERASDVVVAASLLLTLVFGIFLIVAAAPRFWSAVQRLPANGVIQTLGDGGPVAPADLRLADRALASSVALNGRARDLNDLARIRQHRAMAAKLDSLQGRDLLTSSRALQRRALAAAPANAFGWLRLAHTEILLGGLGKPAAAALLQSIATSPFYYPLLWRQLDFAFLLWPVLEPKQRRRIEPQIVAAAAISVGLLAKLAVRRHANGAVRAALAKNGSALSAFDAIYRQRIRL